MQAKPESTKARGKRKAKLEPVARAEEDDPDTDCGECFEVDAPGAPAVGGGGCGEGRSRRSRARGVEDDEVVFRGRLGDLALADFPHFRANNTDANQ